MMFCYTNNIRSLKKNGQGRKLEEMVKRLPTSNDLSPWLSRSSYI
jgi:hypothetical protein